MFLLYVSTSTKPSTGRYIKKHTSKANSIKDIRVQNQNTILLIKIIKHKTINKYFLRYFYNVLNIFSNFN
jgi:hypothetical protein